MPSSQYAAPAYNTKITQFLHTMGILSVLSSRTSLRNPGASFQAIFPIHAQADFFTGEAISLLREAQRARLRARFDFCAIFASRFSCSLAWITSASSVDTFLPSITRKPGVAGMLRAAAAAAERRVTRGVNVILGEGLAFGVIDSL
jgi:hypothetical protein